MTIAHQAQAATQTIGTAVILRHIIFVCSAMKQVVHLLMRVLTLFVQMGMIPFAGHG